MSEEKQDFLRRWSRLKRESAAAPSTASGKSATAGEAPELPPIESLSFESDFRAFMQSKVEETVKRAALKKLFSDPRFNVMDGLDTYIDDYTKEDPIPETLLAQLCHARQTLLAPQEREAEKEREDRRQEQEQAAVEPAGKNGNPGQDPQAL